VPIGVPNIDTDQIIPARFLWRKRSDGFGHLLFHDLRVNDAGEPKPDFVLNQDAYREARIVVAERNFGCGSSREHAVWALQDFGFEAVIAPSFADIFRGNSVGAGLVTAQADEAAVAGLVAAIAADPAAEVVVDVAERTVAVPSAGLSAPFAMPDYTRWRLLEGLDDIGITLRHNDAIGEFERQRPGWLPVSGPRAHATADMP